MANWAMEDQDQQINRLGKCNTETKKSQNNTYCERMQSWGG